MSRINSGNKFVRMLKKGEDKLVKFKYGWGVDLMDGWDNREIVY